MRKRASHPAAPVAATRGAAMPDATDLPPCRTPAGEVYGRLHNRFLRLSGGEAECALEAALTMLLRPGLRMLDAGCGPATVARRLLTQEPALALTLLDNDPRILAAVSDLPAMAVGGSLADLPFADETFDIAFAFWSVETLADPAAGVRELVRVTRPGGRVALAFCARQRTADLIDRLHQLGILLRRSGRFLDPDMVPAALQAAGATRICGLHCRGPARAIMAQRIAP